MLVSGYCQGNARATSEEASSVETRTFFLPSSAPRCSARANDLSLPYLPRIYRVPHYVVLFLPARASSTSTTSSSSSSFSRDRDAIRHLREFYVPTRKERGGRYSSKKVMSRYDTAHSRHFSPYLFLSHSLARSLLLAAREFTPSQPNRRSCLSCKGHVYGELRSCKQDVRRRRACARTLEWRRRRPIYALDCKYGARVCRVVFTRATQENAALAMA